MRVLRTCLILLFVIRFAEPVVTAQGGVVKPSKTEAEAAWNAGNYETAYDHFNGLLLLYSRDPLYKYYAGACLVMLERDIQRAATLLASAINSSAGVKSVPDDVWFWYGRSLQMNGDFDQASEAYDRFTRTAGKKSAQEYKVQEYIDQCLREQGAKGKVQGAGSQEQGDIGTGEKKNESGLKAEEPAKVADIEIPVPEEYKIKLGEVMMLQGIADSLKGSAAVLRKEMETAEPETKKTLNNKAEALEKDAAAKQAEADRILATLEPPNEAKVKVEVEVEAEAEAEGKAEVEDSVAVYSIFEVRETPAYSEEFPIPIDKGAQAGFVYTVQLAAFRNQVKPEFFKGLYPVYGKLKPENGVTYYYAGLFRTLEAARQALTPVRKSGFPDAFVIALMDNVQVSMERAALLEKEWGKKPLLFIESGLREGDIKQASDSLPVGTLTFRAEVMRSKKPVKPEIIEKIQLLAGTRGLDINKNSEGETVFLIGNFITFESADDYVSLLVRNGYSNARVAAFIGMQEIPVEAAKELLKELLND
ncbi:MAG: SPOR domain-containing protein [Bacteroidales bacterium]|nr:SPOR domain-containing protein [Bacteroidales bacterium]